MGDLDQQIREAMDTDDGRTIPEMIAAEPMDEFVVEEAKPVDGGTEVTFDGGLGTILKGPPVKVGDTIGLYTEGRPVFGSQRHGWSLNGKVIEWCTPWERLAERVAWLAQHDRDKRERFERQKAELDAQYVALPAPLKARIDRFRRERRDFRVDSESYEMYAVVDAAKIADHLRPKVEAGADPAEVVKEFHGLSYDEQNRLVGLRDGHSGNTFGGACMLARALLAGEPI